MDAKVGERKACSTAAILYRHSNKISRLLDEPRIRTVNVQNKKNRRDAEVYQGEIRSYGNRAYIGFRVMATNSTSDRMVGLLRRDAKNTRGAYI